MCVYMNVGERNNCLMLNEEKIITSTGINIMGTHENEVNDEEGGERMSLEITEELLVEAVNLKSRRLQIEGAKRSAFSFTPGCPFNVLICSFGHLLDHLSDDLLLTHQTDESDELNDFTLNLKKESLCGGTAV